MFDKHQIIHLNLEEKTNDDSRRTYNTNRQMKLKPSTLKSILGDYSDPCILISGTTTITGAGRKECR